jgi:beta-phosphoglucomutase-like phosphatase (HAD superfamily)
VIEDSRNGLLAATGAGLRCLVTVNGYTKDEDFTEAVLVVSELGDPGRPPVEVAANRGAARPGAYVQLDDLSACLAPRPASDSQAVKSGQASEEMGDQR